jgi:hypothetical protein
VQAEEWPQGGYNMRREDRRGMFLLVVWLVLGGCLVFAAGCGPPDSQQNGVTVPPGWRMIEFGDVVTLAVPGDVVDKNVTPIDSVLSVFQGGGFELALEYGRFAGGIEDHPMGSLREREVDGRRGMELSTRTGTAQPRPVVRMLQVDDGLETLTIMMSCLDEATCRQADAIFSSVRFRSR